MHIIITSEAFYDIFKAFIFLITECIVILNCIIIAKTLFNYTVKLSIRFFVLLACFFSSIIFFQDDMTRLIIAFIFELCLFLEVIQVYSVKTILVFFVCTLFEMFIKASLVIVDIDFVNIDMYTVGSLFEGIITLGIILIISYLIKKKKYKKKYRFTAYYSILELFLNVVCCIFPITIIFIIQEKLDVQTKDILLFAALFVLVMDMLLYWYHCDNLKKNIEYKLELAVKEELIALQNRNAEDTIVRYQNLRKFKHDINTKLQTMKYLYMKKEYEEFITLLDTMTVELNPQTKYMCLDVFITATLNQFINVIEQESIIFNFKYMPLKELNIKEAKICSLFYNLISNAVEAVLKCKEGERMIALKVDSHNNTVFIELVNSIDNKFDINYLKHNITRKEDKKVHGYGFYNIQDIVSDYQGTIDYELKDGKLTMTILMLNAIT